MYRQGHSSYKARSWKWDLGLSLVPFKDYAFINRVDKIKFAYRQRKAESNIFGKNLIHIKIEIEENFVSLINDIYQNQW